ncbi:unnamed protein product, partial [Ectocarpus sp. 12 AP-2014]
MVPLSIVVIRIACLCLTFAYGLVSLSHITAAWMLRKNFYVAVRSPLLATTSGLAGVYIAGSALIHMAIFPGARSLSVLRIIIIPFAVFCFVGVYIVRGLRVVIMYAPSHRKRWGKYLKKESTTVKTMLAAFAAVEVIAWSAVLPVGLERVASFMVIVVKIESLITLGASLALFGKLQRTHDIFKVSLEIRKVGACALLTSAMLAVLGSIPGGILDLYMILFFTIRFYVVVWITNIQPAREILRKYSAIPEDGRILANLFPFVPSLRKGGSTVAVDMAEHRISVPPDSIERSLKLDDTLEQILLSPALLEAFEQYCCRALCSESILFLKAAWAFRDSVHSTTANEATNFAQFMEIFETYIVDGSPFEINIDGRTKATIVKRTNLEVFKQLPQDVAARTLDGAAREVGTMLKENLYDVFQ